MYFFPTQIKNYIFLLFPVLFYYSNKNYFWIAFLLILIEQPGGLFFGGEREAVNRLPLFTLSGNFSISFEQIMIITALLKALKIRKNFTPLLKNQFYLFLLLLFSLVIISIVIGFTFSDFKLLIRYFINLSLFYSVYFLIRNEEDWIRFFRVLFPFAIYALALQGYSLFHGYQVVNLLDKSILATQGILNYGDQAVLSRPIEMIHISFISFFGALYFILIPNNNFSKSYLVLINSASFLSIFITATRSWFIALLVTYIFVILWAPGMIKKMKLKYGLALALVFILFSSINIFETQFNEAFNRIETIKYLAQGDISAGKTLKRFDVRGPAVINAFKNSSLMFGSGFSEQYMKNRDQHVGYHNFLLNSGIFGATILIFFIFEYFFRYFGIYKNLNRRNIYKPALIIFPLWFAAILILNSSTQFIGYDVELNRLFVVIALLFFGNTIVEKATTIDKIFGGKLNNNVIETSKLRSNKPGRVFLNKPNFK